MSMAIEQCRGSLWAFALLGIGCVGCATTAQQPVDLTAENAADQALAASQYEYIIGPGDMLDIFVWGYEDLSTVLPVRPDGRITTRLIEDLQASGKTTTQLARDIEARYEDFVKNPSVSVSINEFVGSPSQQVKVVGGGAEPQVVPYKRNMSLLDLMITAGGLGEFSRGNKAVLVRTIEGQRTSTRVRLHDLLKKGDISANQPVYPGDVLIIPETWF